MIKSNAITVQKRCNYSVKTMLLLYCVDREIFNWDYFYSL